MNAAQRYNAAMLRKWRALEAARKKAQGSTPKKRSVVRWQPPQFATAFPGKDGAFESSYFPPSFASLGRL